MSEQDEFGWTFSAQFDTWGRTVPEYGYHLSVAPNPAGGWGWFVHAPQSWNPWEGVVVRQGVSDNPDSARFEATEAYEIYIFHMKKDEVASGTMKMRAADAAFGRVVVA